MIDMKLSEALQLQMNKIKEEWERVMEMLIDPEFINSTNRKYGEAKENLNEKIAKLWKLKELFFEISSQKTT